MFTRILVPLDGSDNAERSLPYARALARTLEIPVTLITVVETAADGFPKKVRDLDTRIQESMVRALIRRRSSQAARPSA